MTRRTGRIPWPSKQQSLLPQMLYALVKFTEGLLPGLVTDAVSPTLSQATAVPLVYNVASIAISTFGNTGATLGQPLDPYPEEQKTATPGIDPLPNAEEEGTTIKA